MRNLFLVGSKILGLYSLFKCLLFIPSIANSIGYFRGQSDELGCSPERYLMLLIVSFSLYLFFGLIMTFRTTQLANILSIKDEPNQQFDLPKIELFKIGVNILGIYILITSIPALASTIYKLDRLPGEYAHKTDLIIYGLQTLFGFILVLAGRNVVKFISRKEARV